jgi:DNA transposition AAA+ family ATPase
MNDTGSVSAQRQVAPALISSPRAADQIAANAAHAAQSCATAQLSAARGSGDTGAVKQAQQALAGANAAATRADAWVGSDSGLNIVA